VGKALTFGSLAVVIVWYALVIAGVVHLEYSIT
jgi:hypothetical protein